MPSDNNSQEKKKEVDISQYRDPTSGLTMKKLERSLWLFEHKSHFKQAVIIALFLVCLLTWGYTLYYATMYLAVGMERDAEMMRGLTTNQLPGHEYTLKVAPKPLITSRVRTFNLDDKLDLITEVENPNPRHYAYFDYCFSGREEELKCDREFISPEGSKYVFALAQPRQGASNVTFSIEKTNWYMINKHEIPDWEEHESKRSNFEFEDIDFVPAHSSDLSEKIDMAHLSFNVFNDTSYNYYKVPLKIFLYRGGQIAGVNQYTLTNFYSQEEETVELTWPDFDQSVNKVEVVPDLDIMDQENYLSPRR